MPWQKLLDAALAMGYTSHQARTCGLHVHVSLEAFGETETAQDAVIDHILYFFEKFWDELLKFSRRTPRQLEQWVARGTGSRSNRETFWGTPKRAVTKDGIPA